ncbi:aldose 1-epimerase family protein [Pseudooceanicola sp. C21-150M6]|uniref:aldose 1-epimerase family protein n=1 Tax=Pseudooceanicola sp. C21-150M6 TaxID=3434355 RepID=UPI003D7F4136
MAEPEITEIGTQELRVAVSDLGAEMQALSHLGRALLWHGDAAWWGGRSPVLFPIVGRAPEDRISVGGAGAGMSQHGFARRRIFERVAVAPDQVTHRLVADAETRAVFPRDFELSLTHRVEGSSLSVAAEVANPGEVDLPFGLGFHPAFCWPLPGAEGLPHRVVLENGAAPQVTRLSDGLLTAGREDSPFRGGEMVLDPALFEANALVFEEGTGAVLRYGADRGPVLRFEMENLPRLGIWQPPGAPFICIEPWHGIAARLGAGPAIEDRPGTVTLAPKEAMRFVWSVTVEPGWG